MQSNRKHVSKQPQAKFRGREGTSQCYLEFSNIFYTKGKKTRDPNAAQLQSQAHKSLGCVIQSLASCSATYSGLSANKNIFRRKKNLKKKGSQQHDSAEGTLRQSRKQHRIIFGAVSRFLETHSTFLFHLLNNLRLGICTKHFIFFFFSYLVSFLPLKQQLQSRQKQASPQELTRILQRLD